jgi:hypothetical protein
LRRGALGLGHAQAVARRRRRPSAARATDTRCSSVASVVLPPRIRARARSSAWLASTCAASAWTMVLRAWAIAASARVRVAAFWASCVSSTSRESRASTCPCFTTVPSSTSTSAMR